MQISGIYGNIGFVSIGPEACFYSRKLVWGSPSLFVYVRGIAGQVHIWGSAGSYCADCSGTLSCQGSASCSCAPPYRGAALVTPSLILVMHTCLTHRSKLCPAFKVFHGMNHNLGWGFFDWGMLTVLRNHKGSYLDYRILHFCSGIY